jgi:hypothetical protein
MADQQVKLPFSPSSLVELGDYEEKAGRSGGEDAISFRACSEARKTSGKTMYISWVYRKSMLIPMTAATAVAPTRPFRISLVRGDTGESAARFIKRR